MVSESDRHGTPEKQIRQKNKEHKEKKMTHSQKECTSVHAEEKVVIFVYIKGNMLV